MAKEFKIQIPQSIVRNPEINSKSFVLLAKLIQQYNSQPENTKSLTFTFKSYPKFMNFVDIANKKTFKKSLDDLIEKGLVTNKIKALPRNGQLTITLSPNVITDLNKGQMFTQMESGVLNMSIIEEIGHVGVRILYYIMSWINYQKPGKDHCYASVERMAKDIAVTEKTFIKYIKILEELKFIRVKRFDIRNENFKTDKNGNESLLLDRWNNHYFIKHDNIKKFNEKSSKLIV
ncbi:helix-turn-helix domain-containing protein [Peribacillus frigoritolerans]|uniref:helix-turn-helix domain-containing protein n=1 Tax=Peribacillus frigoritolerans TaxID=450367 RepID=UPI00222643F2|nr:helix-turn-helix domain-containing protein [Peribacillus frigoritolerans]UYZ01188.1 helix-turn-helix domain-containing protein [Peribacillus frigoritolerans]